MHFGIVEDNTWIEEMYRNFLIITSTCQSVSIIYLSRARHFLDDREFGLGYLRKE